MSLFVSYITAFDSSTERLVREWLYESWFRKQWRGNGIIEQRAVNNVVVDVTQNGQLVAMAGRAIVRKGQRWQVERERRLCGRWSWWL